MNINRAPRGIPTGGQFVSTSHSEPNITLSYIAGGPARQPDEPKVAPIRNLGFLGGGRQIMDWNTDAKVDYDSLSEDEQVRVREMAKEYGFPDPRRTGLRKTVEHIGDELGETVDALSEVTGHIVDVQRGDVTPEVEGTFVGWNQMLPKFMRRKNQS
jgi:hypothetical protein